jgi:membrane-associated phospholipid phosphatase
MFDRSTNRFVTSVFLVSVVFTSSLCAQSVPEASPTDDPAQEAQVSNPDPKPLQLPSKDVYFQKGFAHQLIADQKPLWTSPAHIKASDAKWLAPLAGGTAFLFTQDNKISQHFANKPSLQNASLTVGTIGSITPWAMPGAFLALGKARGDDRMIDTGKKGLQAQLYAELVMHAMKTITDRARPGDGGTGHFWTGGDSFPSGHAMSAWALAKVVSDEYSDKRFVKISMYTFATAISLSRITAEKHYPSDVLVGSGLGYMLGKFVMRDHQAPQMH